MDVIFLKSLIEEKLSVPQIAKKIGKSESTVFRLLKKHKLKTFRHINKFPNKKNKKCRYCGKTKKIEDFNTSGNLNGKIYYRNKCKNCHLKTKNKRRELIKDWYRDLKKTLSCSHCGNSDFRVIQFHHEKNNKEGNISDMVSSANSKKNILKEIKKCIPLCANCHCILHFEKNKFCS
jgi:hypothetical protein